MTELDVELAELSAAEEFFAYFGLEFNPAVVNVNRLHILKRFNQYLRHEGRGEDLSADARHAHYRAQLLHAYQDFVRSTPAQEKVFKVFQDADGKSVSLDALKASLAERQPAASR